MRRVHLPDLRTGPLRVGPDQSHHLRDVLRLTAGDRVQAFDSVGRTAEAVVVEVDPVVSLRIETIALPSASVGIVVASAVPKGDRADWMVEKLSELGVSVFVPLRTARSVVHPEGAGKLDRWNRIAVEAAKQSRRTGVMKIEPLADVQKLLPTLTSATYFSTRPDAKSFRQSTIDHRQSAFLLIGPEGGWTAEEESAFETAGVTAASLGPTILRIETAAVLAAGVMSLSVTSTR